MKRLLFSLLLAVAAYASFGIFAPQPAAAEVCVLSVMDSCVVECEASDICEPVQACDVVVSGTCTGTCKVVVLANCQGTCDVVVNGTCDGDCDVIVGDCDKSSCDYTVGSCTEGGECFVTVGACTGGDCLVTVGVCYGACDITVGECPEQGTCFVWVGSCPVEFLDGTACAELAAREGTYGPVEVRHDGDVYVSGEWIWDCPPFGA